MFEGLQEARELRRSGSVRHPETLETLQRIVALMPNHQSARYLLKIAQGKSPRHLTLESTILEGAFAIRPISPFLIRSELRDGTITRDTLSDLKQRAGKLRVIGHPDAKGYCEAVISYVNLVNQLSTRQNLSQRDSDKLRDAIRDLAAASNTLGANQQVIEQLGR